MSNKEIVKDLLERLPEEASFLEIAHEVEFLAGVRSGLEQADQAKFISVDELRDEVRQWACSK
jgi:hypothetical protein